MAVLIFTVIIGLIAFIIDQKTGGHLARLSMFHQICVFFLIIFFVDKMVN